MCYIIQQNHISQMNNFGNKVVENYAFESLRFVNSDCCSFLDYLAQFWTARHKIFNKVYTIKRYKYNQTNSINFSAKQIQTQHDRLLPIIQRQIQILKNIRGIKIPKCNKMIKTINNIYLILDQFQGITIEQLLDSRRITFQQQILLMQNVAKQLDELHKRGLVIGVLPAKSILVQELQNNIFFSEWIFACMSGHKLQNNHFISNYDNYIAAQTLQTGVWTFASDVYSLGKLYQYIQTKSPTKEAIQSMKLDKMIQQMIAEDPRKRLGLDQVIQTLQKLHQSKLTSKILLKQVAVPNSTKYKRQKYLRTAQSKPKLPNSSSISRMKTNYSNGFLIKNNKQIKVSSFVIINKNRNLAFFLMDLSEFVINSGIEFQLGYILLKKGYLLLSNCYDQLYRLDYSDSKNIKVLRIIKQEVIQYTKIFYLIQSFISKQEYNSAELKRQLLQISLVNEEYLKQCVISFSKQILEFYDKEMRYKELQTIIDNLFKVYLMEKCIQDGSYEQFWERIYDPNLIYFRNQRTIKEQKQLGYRYLRSKIMEIAMLN